jgi:toxin ParE1/3/4
MRFAFHPEALSELKDAADFYSDREKGLELRFIDAVRTAISSICESPQRNRIFHGEIRRHLVHVFPYAVLYSIEEGFIYIIAIMHCSRKPEYWMIRRK